MSKGIQWFEDKVEDMVRTEVDHILVPVIVMRKSDGHMFSLYRKGIPSVGDTLYIEGKEVVVEIVKGNVIGIGV